MSLAVCRELRRSRSAVVRAMPRAARSRDGLASISRIPLPKTIFRSGRPMRKAFLSFAILVGAHASEAQRSGNPILPGWYADPEVHVFAGQYWIYPTYS